jgi:hypothetical protein
MTISNFITITLMNDNKIYGNSVKSVLDVLNDMYKDNECFSPVSVSQLNKIISNKPNKFKKLIKSVERIPMNEYFKSQLSEFKMNDDKYSESYNKKRYVNRLRELYAVEIYKLRRDLTNQNCKL